MGMNREVKSWLMQLQDDGSLSVTAPMEPVPVHKWVNAYIDQLPDTKPADLVMSEVTFDQLVSHYRETVPSFRSRRIKRSFTHPEHVHVKVRKVI